MPDIFLYPGEADPDDVKLRDPTILDGGGASPVTGTATFEQAAATWDAAASERITATATWEQTAAWGAAATEHIPGTATWSQDAAWAALGMSAEDVLTTATFEQAAASWLAATSELMVGSGTWEQVSTWLAAGAEAFILSATFEQTAAWDATASTPVPVTSTATWGQAPAEWDAFSAASSDGPLTSGAIQFPRWRTPSRRRTILERAPMPLPAIAVRGSFTQAPTQWSAVVTADVSRARETHDEEALVALM